MTSNRRRYDVALRLNACWDVDKTVNSDGMFNILERSC